MGRRNECLVYQQESITKDKFASLERFECSRFERQPFVRFLIRSDEGQTLETSALLRISLRWPIYVHVPLVVNSVDKLDIHVVKLMAKTNRTR